MLDSKKCTNVRIVKVSTDNKQLKFYYKKKKKLRIFLDDEKLSPLLYFIIWKGELDCIRLRGAVYAILNGGRMLEADLWGNFSSRALCGNYPDSFNRENPSHGKVSLSAVAYEQAAT